MSAAVTTGSGWRATIWQISSALNFGGLPILLIRNSGRKYHLSDYFCLWKILLAEEISGQHIIDEDMTLRARIRRPPECGAEPECSGFDALGESLDNMTYDSDPENHSGHDQEAQPTTQPAASASPAEVATA